jgi:hypothetical protein
MEALGFCGTHKETVATFRCAGCGGAYCAGCQGKLLDGRQFCLGCSLRLASRQARARTREEEALHRDKVARTEVELAAGRGRRRWIAALLAVALPVIALELYFLSKNRPRERTAELEMAAQASLLYSLTTSLEQYREETGEYPVRLELLLQGFWQDDDDDLRNFEYLRPGPDRFTLKIVPEGGGAGLAYAQEGLPETVDQATDFSVIFRRLQKR